MKKHPEMLEGISSHMTYEVQMMMQCAGLMMQSPSPEDFLQPAYLEYMVTIKNAVLEAFLLHVRNVHEFLFNYAPKDDTVAAIHYFDDASEWQSTAEPLNTTILIKGKRRINKRLTHVTRNRVQPVENLSEMVFEFFIRDFYQTMVRDLAKALKVFVDGVPDSKTVSSLKSYLSKS